MLLLLFICVDKHVFCEKRPVGKVVKGIAIGAKGLGSTPWSVELETV